MPASQGCKNGPDAPTNGRWGRGRPWWLVSARVGRIGREGRVAPDPGGGKVTRLDELVGRMRPGLEQRVEHLVTDQPFLGQGIGRQINAVAVPDPPPVALLLAQGDGARRG